MCDLYDIGLIVLQMPKARRNVLRQREVKVIEGRVLALSRRETCCMYIVTDNDGRLSEIKRYYVQTSQGINVEDEVR